MRFFIGIILARLLFPEQFGLIGMMTIFMAVAQSFFDSGFGAALIQKREVTATETSSVFYFNIFVGLLAAGLLCLFAPWIADFYNQPILTPLTRALSLTIVINSFGMIQNTILAKQINFKVLTKINLTATILSGIIGVSMAVWGYGVWSLVLQQISKTAIHNILLWFMNSWRPKMIISFKSLRELFAFGSKLLASGLLNQIFDNIYLLVIGKLFSATDLGFYTRAKSLEEIPSRSLAGMVGQVTFPVFSTIKEDQLRLKRVLKKAITAMAIINFPMMIGMALIARPLVMVLLTEKWAESINYLQLLCLLGLLFPLHVINLDLLKALGRSDLFLRLEIIKKFLIVINIVLTWRWGISAMIIGMMGTSIISYYLNSYYTGKLIGYPISEQLKDMFIYLTMAGVMGIVVFGLGFLPFANNLWMILTQIPIGIVVYVGMCRFLRLGQFMEIWVSGWNKISFFKAGKAI